MIRSYQNDDEAAVFTIAADTAFFGDPVEEYMEDRQLFCDLVYRYYTTFEAGTSWVVEDDAGVAGFLMGCLDTRQLRQRWLRSILPAVLSRLVRARYLVGPRTRRHFMATVRSTVRYGRPGADLACYPSHLHMNLLPRTRGQGYGTRLLQTYLDQIEQLGVSGVHLNTTDYNVAACRLYEKMGFEVLDSRPTTAWDGLVAEKIENRCYGLRFAGNPS